MLIQLLCVVDHAVQSQNGLESLILLSHDGKELGEGLSRRPRGGNGFQIHANVLRTHPVQKIVHLRFRQISHQDVLHVIGVRVVCGIGGFITIPAHKIADVLVQLGAVDGSDLDVQVLQDPTYNGAAVGVFCQIVEPDYGLGYF